MQSKYVRYLLVVTVMGSLYGQEKELTFEKLESLVSQQNPELAALSKEIRASEGILLQESLRLNPELEVESGTGGDPETIVQLNQTFQLGSKRAKRTGVARHRLERAKLIYQIRKLDIMAEATSSFIDVLTIQEIINLNEERTILSEEFLTAVKMRVSAGRLSLAEESRAQVALVSTQIELNRSRRMLKNRWRQLASFWGSTSPTYKRAVGDLDEIGVLPIEESLIKEVEKSPRIVARELNIKIEQSVLNLEQARRMPDLTVGAGIKRTDVPDNTYQIGFSIPLPVLNRNQGAIMEAEALLEQAMDNKQVIEIQLRTEIQTFYSELLMAYDEIQSLMTTFLPEAENAYRIINDGYLQGKFNYLDVVDAQNTLFEGRESLLLALSEYHNARLELERLLGQSLK